MSIPSYRCDTIRSWHFHLLEFSFHFDIIFFFCVVLLLLQIFVSQFEHEAGIDNMKGDVGGNHGKRHLEISIAPGLYEMKVKRKMMEGEL